MKEMYKAFMKKLFGAGYERLKKTLPVYVIVFGGLYMADLPIQIAPLPLYLAVSTFTAGVMWQALSSEDNSVNMKNLFMLPFEKRSFIFAYVSALGTYTIFTKTAGLLAVMFAVSVRSGTEIFGSLLCAVNAVLMTACIYAKKRDWVFGLIWAGAVMAAIFLLCDMPVFFPVLIGNMSGAVLLLSGVDAYAFYFPEGRDSRIVKSSRRCSVWRYLSRYLMTHKNYLINTIALWGIACVLPFFLGALESLSVVPVGFAVLSLNTPLCILLSCDPALERAVRFLPGQKKAFLIPYGLFLFLCNMAVDVIFLCSWQIQMGGITVVMVLEAVCFALLSAAGSVLLEWFYPIRNWKIESDLWHHPRKYVVPAAMLLLAGVVGMV